MIRTTSFNIFFPPILNVRELIFKLENDLSEYFVKPFNLFPLPNEAPPEFPRISASSHHGYTTLNISINSAQIVTNYDANFSNDWSKCEAYIKDRIYKVYDLLSPHFSNRLLFCGLTTDLLLDTRETTAVQQIKESFFKLEHEEPFDLSCRVTFVKDSKYYLNYLIQNQRLSSPSAVSGIPMKQIENEHQIEVNLDINDRYALNYNPQYISSRGAMDEILEITREIVTKKIDKIVFDGRFD